jgi:hypothetical protein
MVGSPHFAGPRFFAASGERGISGKFFEQAKPERPFTIFGEMEG